MLGSFSFPHSLLIPTHIVHIYLSKEWEEGDNISLGVRLRLLTFRMPTRLLCKEEIPVRNKKPNGEPGE